MGQRISRCYGTTVVESFNYTKIDFMAESSIYEIKSYFQMLLMINLKLWERNCLQNVNVTTRTECGSWNPATITLPNFQNNSARRSANMHTCSSMTCVKVLSTRMTYLSSNQIADIKSLDSLYIHMCIYKNKL
jgi:hypothetical protein